MAATGSMKAIIKSEDDDWTMSNFCEVVMLDDSAATNGRALDADAMAEENGTATGEEYGNGTEGVFPCDQCKRDFLTARELKSHRRTHNPERPHICEICEKRFRQKGHLEDHMRTHTDERPYACSYCDRTFRQKGDLNIHVRTHTGENLHECNYCDKSFNRKSTLNTHLLTHTRERAFACQFCPKTFGQRTRWLSHLEEHMMGKAAGSPPTPAPARRLIPIRKAPSPEMMPNGLQTAGRIIVIGLPDGTFVETEDLNEYFKSEPPVTNKSHTCLQCDTSYVHKELLDLHVQTHLSAKRFMCEHCNKTFTQENVFKRHVASHRSELHVCHYCQKAFSQKKYLTIHLKSHPGEDASLPSSNNLCPVQPFDATPVEAVSQEKQQHTCTKPHVCHYCQKGFKQKQSLKNHLLSHTGKTNICPYCRAMIKNEEEFTAHVAKHTIDLPFVCHFCQKAFRKRPNLNMHLRTHTGEKPYKCKYCNKAFRLQPNLKCHLRVHTGEKPYICNYCGKGFAQQTAWKSHVQLHTGKKYECGYCCTAFAVRAHLKNHILMHHTNQQPYMCSLCCDRYDNEKQLLDHWQSKVILGSYGKVGCGLYQLFMSILDRPIITALGLQDRFPEDVFVDFIQAAGQTAVATAGDEAALQERVTSHVEQFIGIILELSGMKMEPALQNCPLQKTIFEMLLVLKNKENYLNV